MKQQITISAQVEDIKRAKELLLDLEALSEKYEVVIDLNVCHQVILEEFCTQI